MVGVLVVRWWGCVGGGGGEGEMGVGVEGRKGYIAISGARKSC